jgi:hypothetical protein
MAGKPKETTAAGETDATDGLGSQRDAGIRPTVTKTRGREPLHSRTSANDLNNNWLCRGGAGDRFKTDQCT